MKYNHVSGMNIICKNKNILDIEHAIIKLKEQKNINYGLETTEFQYVLLSIWNILEKIIYLQ